MAISSRQQNLFASEDWTVAYKAYSNINFQAYDFDTIRAALVDYIRVNFPENFNDYIESSEFIAIIELLAYLSQSLAFRMDVNTRENFLETAERRDSVFKLARMLGYNPKRNVCASGLLKLISVKTTEPLRDSQGRELTNRNIFWDDANNPQSYEQFILVMNAAMSSANRFTSPLKTGYVGDVLTELYQINTSDTAPLSYTFNLTVNGNNKPFNVINPDFIDTEYFYERHPNPANLFNMIYRNDGKGLASKDTGFFLMFKQGNLAFKDFNYTVPVQSRIQNIDAENINETDVFLQEIDLTGQVKNQWEKISNTVGQTVNYNSILKNTKNLYAVETVGTTGIRLKFSDGNFGNIPVGIYRAWYRTSDPTSYTIMPEDARNVSINIPYVARNGRSYLLTVVASLQYSVTNSAPAESLDNIKSRASDVFYTQNRMVSAQDYNVFPISQSTNIKKIKAINRTHAGHSRYIDINDPTGSYQNVDVYAKDAYLYVEDAATSEQITIDTINITTQDVVTGIIPEYLKSRRLNNFVYYTLRNAYIENDPNPFALPSRVIWKTLPVATTSKTGYVTETFSLPPDEQILLTNTDLTAVFRENNFIKWVNPENTEEYKWTRVVNIYNNGQLDSAFVTAVGSWTLSEEVNHNWEATEVFVSIRKLFNTDEADDIMTEIDARRTFGLGYNALLDSWYIIPSGNIDRTGAFATANVDAGQESTLGASWLLLFDYVPVDALSYRYNVTIRGQEYVIQSKNDLRFYNIKSVKSVGSDNRSSQDLITYTTVNSKPSTAEVYEWKITSSGNYWVNKSIPGSAYIPQGYTTNIPLKTRNTKWYEVSVSWKSNFGILQPGTATDPAIIVNNSYAVTDATVTLNTFFDNGTAASLSSNVTIANNTGQISRIPSNIIIPFDSTTFGGNILDTSGNITYRQYSGITNLLEVFHGNANIYSYGTQGLTPDINSPGRLQILDANVSSQSGNLVYTQLAQNIYHSSQDTSGTFGADKLVVNYLVEKEALEIPIDWSISDTYKYTDGFTDSRKVVVSPLDTDGDLVPDRPLQFFEYVGTDDVVLFEYFTDFDGYTYDRPVSELILDYRFELSPDINIVENTISPQSHYDPTPLSTVGWIIVNDAQSFFPTSTLYNSMAGIKVYSMSTDTVYQITVNSTDTSIVSLTPTTDYFVKAGRGQTQNTDAVSEDSVIRWRHVAPNDVRIDPSISNVVEMIVLTNDYYDSVTKYTAYPKGDFPAEPTSSELSIEFQALNEYKNASDSLVYRSAKFKRLFGNSADAEYRAKFRVVKLSTQYTDNELKSRIITAINEYFDVDNWEFGETFYFTELSTYIHQQLGSAIGSIVIVPKNTSGTFGQLFQVKAEPNELFLNTATVNDIELISKIDSQTLRVDR